MFIPASIAADTIESLTIEQGPEQPWIYRLLLLGAIGALASLPFVQVDLAVRVAGIVRPATERVELRPAMSGLVESVLVRDNEQVEAGQPLLALVSVDVDARIARNRALQEESRTRIADLQEAVTSDEVPAETHWRTPALIEDWNAYRAQRESCRLAGTKAAAEHARCALLAEKGIATRQDLENARFEMERWHSEARLLRAQTLARWQARLQEESAALAQLESEAQRLEEERAHYTICAPASGVLVGFSGWSAGGFVAAGQVLGSVSPDEALMVETRVSSRDAGLVHVGQRVRLQVDAYAYTWWGTLDGEVTAISGDAIQAEGTTMPGFKVTIRPATTRLALPTGVRAELRKGLTVSTRFLVARRSLLQLLYDESAGWLNPQDRGPT